MMMKNKVVTCSVLIIVLTACILCTGCTSTPGTQSPVQTVPPSVTIPSQPQSSATPEQTLSPEDTSAQPAPTPAPGDPSKVLDSYPSLFNAGNAAGIFALLSENMKSHYPLDSVNNELATARSNGYSIEKIQGNNQIIEEDSAILEVEITWKISGSPQTSTPRFYLVYENNQWKLDSLIVNPYTS